MGGLSDAILEAAKESRRPRPGDIVFIIRRNAVAPGNIPNVNALISRCRVVREQTNGARVVVLDSETGLPDEGEGVFIDRRNHAILTTRAAAIEYAATMISDVLGMLETMRAQAQNVMNELNENLAVELSE
ncbi:hypothetical protein DOC35_19540 [Salmonella enterica subsp. enterica]|nr:hypothetical protein [Salmonella enterica subsp. enterica]